MEDSDLRRVCESFVAADAICEISELGHGLINNTFLVTTSSSGGDRFVLQKINQQVFSQPHKMLDNFIALTEHVRKYEKSGTLGNRQFYLPELKKTRCGKYCVFDDNMGFWRAMDCIEGSMTLNAVCSMQDAEEVGFALGHFHRLIHDLDIQSLHDTLPGFHITPRILQEFFAVFEQSKCSTESPEFIACLEYIQRWKHRVDVLENAKRLGKLHLRPIHGDPKLNNILFDVTTRRAKSIIDLDTVKPGLIHYDIGDCLRSACNSTNKSSDSVVFDIDICEAILGQYLNECSEFLGLHDFDFIYDAIHLIPYELGLRFLTDYLEGNHYFKISYAEENLFRALNQFRLTESIENSQQAIRKLVMKFSSVYID